MLRGQYYHKKGKLESAERAYRSAMRIDPYLAQPDFYLANIKYAQNDFHTAKKFFQTAIDKDSNNVDAYFSLGLLNAEMQNLEAAEKALSKAAILSGNPRYYYSLGLTLQNIEKPIEAEKVYLSALKINPQSESILYALSILYVQQTQMDKAKLTISQLLAINPENQDYQNLLRSIR